MNSFKFHCFLEISIPEFNTSTQLRYVGDDSSFENEHVLTIDDTDSTIPASGSIVGLEQPSVDDVIIIDDTSSEEEDAEALDGHGDWTFFVTVISIWLHRRNLFIHFFHSDISSFVQLEIGTMFTMLHILTLREICNRSLNAVCKHCFSHQTV